MQLDNALIDIDTLSRELNLGKDRLRIWERRYGFPQPLRRDDGQRVYPPEQVQRLRQICRLLDGGARAGDVLPLSDEALQQRIDAHQVAVAQALPELDSVSRLAAMREQLVQLPAPDAGSSISRWIEQYVEPFTTAVGQAWAAGQLPVWGEHLLTEVLQRRLGQLLCQQPVAEAGPRVLLCTPPGEQHRLGLLMAELVLNDAGARTCSLGSEVPIDEICAAAVALEADVLALSCSARQKRQTVLAMVNELRRNLPGVAVWIGGSGASHLRRLPEGVQAVRRLRDAPRLLAALERRHSR